MGWGADPPHLDARTSLTPVRQELTRSAVIDQVSVLVRQTRSPISLSPVGRGPGRGGGRLGEGATLWLTAL